MHYSIEKRNKREVLYFPFKCSLLILFVLTTSISHSLSFNFFTAIIPVFIVHRCGPPGRRDSGQGLPTALASHDTLRKNRATIVSQGALFQSHHLPVAHLPHLFAVQVRISWNLWYSQR